VNFSEALQKYKDLYLFHHLDGRVLFRLMDYASYKSARYVMLTYPNFKFDIEDEIWEKYVVEHTLPNAKDDLGAGIVTTVAQLILYLSCPQSIDGINEQLAEARTLLSDAREQAIIAVCEAFPTYTPEIVEKMSWQTITRRLAQSEQILKRELAFQSPASQPPSDSDRIFERLEEFTDTAVDFSKVNNELYNEEFGAPAGDFNLKNIRG